MAKDDSSSDPPPKSRGDAGADDRSAPPKKPAANAKKTKKSPAKIAAAQKKARTKKSASNKPAAAKPGGKKAMLESAERLRIAKEAAQLGIHDWNIRTGELIWDTTVRKLWGWDAEERATFETFMEGVHSADRVDTRAAVDRALDPEGDGQYRVEYRVVHRSDGPTRWVAATGQVRFEDGEAVRLIGTVQDITVRKTAELELEKWADRLEERVAERTADLRALAGQVTDAEQRARRHLAEALHNDLQQILAAAKMRLPAEGGLATGEELAAIGSLLDDGLSKTRSMIAELSPPVLHEGTLPDAFRWLSRHMEEIHNFTVNLEIEDDLGELDDSRRVMLFNAVRELLFNAVKHSGVGEAQLKLCRENGNLNILVADHGKGFDPRIIHRTDRDSFGLLNIRERFDAYGGSITIETAPGEGARFNLQLPLGTKIREPHRLLLHPPIGNRDPRQRDTNDDDCIRIVIADDHKLMRDGLRQILEAEPDFEIIGEAANGREAIDIAHSLHPDVVLMDISMPGINGIEATRELVGHFPEMQIIGLSLHEEEDLGSTMVEAGAAAFLQKDVPGSTLIRKVRDSGPSATVADDSPEE